MRLHRAYILILFLSYFSVSAQKSDSLLLSYDPILAELDSLLASPDSVSFLGLLDSLLTMEPVKSQLALRIGYNSNVNTFNRGLTINQFGLSPGISYFHKSGAYADVSAYWSQEYDPSVYLSVASAGYMASLTKKWSVFGEYSRYIYTYTDNSPVSYFDKATSTYVTYTPNTPYTNNLQVSNYVNHRKFVFRFDYSFLFGQQMAHRFSPSLGISLQKKKWLGLDRVSFFPSCNLLFGSDVLPAKTTVTYDPITTRWVEIVYRYRRGLPLFERKETVQPASTVWGVMNYGVNFPISLSLKKWSLLLNYTYNFPQPLSGEELDLNDSGFLSMSLTRYLEF